MGFFIMNIFAVVKNCLLGFSIVSGFQLVAMEIGQLLNGIDKLQITKEMSWEDFSKLTFDQQKKIKKETAETICINHKISLIKNISLYTKEYIDKMKKVNSNNNSNRRELFYLKYCYADLKLNLTDIQENEKELGTMQTGLIIANNREQKQSGLDVESNKNTKKRVLAQTEGAKESGIHKKRRLNKDNRWI